MHVSDVEVECLCGAPHSRGHSNRHLATFAEHVREGLASTAVGLEVMADMMEAEVTYLAGVKAATTFPGPTPVTALSTARSPLVAGGCR